MKYRLLFLIALTLTLAACGNQIEPGRTNVPAETVRGLTVATVGSSAVSASRSFVGTVESSDRSTLAARIDGRVSRIAVREGDMVRAGEVLLTIEQNTAGERLAEAQGGERAAVARLELAEKNLERYLQLQRANAVTPQEMDRVLTERELASQALASARAQVEQARTALSFTQVAAPYAARVARRDVEVGSTVMPGTPLFILERSDSWHVRLEVPESWVGKLRPGESMPVEIPALKRTIDGTISEIVPANDPRSRSFAVKVALRETSGLTSGLYARAARLLDSSQTLLVPATALVQRGQLTGLYVVDQGILRWRLVKTGRSIGEQIEILSGLDNGEQVVTVGVERAKSGAKVEN